MVAGCALGALLVIVTVAEARSDQVATAEGSERYAVTGAPPAVIDGEDEVGILQVPEPVDEESFPFTDTTT